MVGEVPGVTVEPDVARMLSWLDDLIACDTSFPPGAGYGAFADHLEALLAPMGFACRRVEVPERLWSSQAYPVAGARVNLIAERRRGRPPCHVYFHVDTVPAGSGWTRPPLALTVEGDRLYGRGTSDMKGTIAAALGAIAAADAANTPLSFDPVLLFCTDEEGGLYPGVRWLAEQGEITGHVLCLNGGAAPRIWAGCFGSLDLAIKVTGRAAHSGDPVGGVNAIDAALPILNALAALRPMVEARVSDMPPPPHFGGRPLTARLTVTGIQAGAKGSALPGECLILVNRRYTPDERFDAVLEELRGTVAMAAAEGGALDVATDLVGHLSPVRDPDQGPHWPLWRRALAVGFGWAPGEFRRWGASSSSDMGFVQACGQREILLGGLSRPGNNGHAADEHTTIGDLVALARALHAYLTGPTPHPSGERP